VKPIPDFTTSNSAFVVASTSTHLEGSGSIVAIWLRYRSFRLRSSAACADPQATVHSVLYSRLLRLGLPLYRVRLRRDTMSMTSAPAGVSKFEVVESLEHPGCFVAQAVDASNEGVIISVEFFAHDSKRLADEYARWKNGD
jgi:hypothetical protein